MAGVKFYGNNHETVAVTNKGVFLVQGIATGNHLSNLLRMDP